MERSGDLWFSFGQNCLSLQQDEPQQASGLLPTLVFLHGRYGHAGIWRHLTERFSRRFRCMTIDLPGFGRSFGVRGGGLPLQEESRMIGYLLRRIARSTGAPLVLVGHDVGGAIAQLCAIQWPGIVSGLVLINSAALTRAPVHLNVGTFCLRARRRLARLLDHRSARALTREDKDAISAAWQDRTLRATMHSVFESWRESWPGPHERKAWGSKLTGLSQPTLLLWGRQDQISEIDHADELIRMIPEAYLFEHELCGHWPSLEDRDWVHRKMTEFLFRTEERQLIAI